MSFKQEFAKCSQCDCSEERLIVNRTHFLCDQKNRIRLDGQVGDLGKGKKKRFIQATMKQGKGMRNFSKKRSTIETRYQGVQRDMKESGNCVCDECSTSERLSFSHLIPRSFRPDLIDEPRIWR